MSVAVSADPTVGVATDEDTPKRGATFWVLLALAVLVLVSGVRVLTGVNDVTSSGTLRAALVGMIPIALAGLGGLWSERAGVVNIGLEGMLIVGTLGGAYFAYHYGVLAGVLGAMLFGLLAACLHALATVLLGVDHIVSGVAINIIAAGLAAFLAKVFFSDLPGGGPTQSPPIGKPWTISLPWLHEPLRTLEGKHWFLVSDLAAVGAAVTRNLSVLTVVALLLFVATWWILWHTPFGLRLRSTGEAPSAAESLGVPVYTYKFVAVAMSGALAGLGGAYLAMVSASGYSNGLSQNMGYIGLAAMIFGNWRPGGLLLGASLFGYTQSLRLRPDGGDSLHALLLVIAIVLVAIAVVQFRDKRTRAGAITLAGALAFLVWFLATDAVPRDVTGMAPYLATLLVLTFAAQKLRMPAADGQVYRKGSAG
jgi:simple sugar transport system permease protein